MDRQSTPALSPVKKIAFKTFGCKANTTDTDAMHLEASRLGFQIVDESERADAYVINSCTVTYHADRDARAQALRYKRHQPEALVAVVGCYAQVAKEELLALPEVDLVVGTANKYRVLDHLNSAFLSHPVDRDQVEPTMGFLPEVFRGSRNARAPLKIQDGCNFKCSFCIIPQARGRSRSLPIDNIVQQCIDARAQGFREVVLTGIHIAHYGWDMGTDLESLLRKLISIPDVPRIRVSTLDPFEIPDSLIQLFASEKILCPHYHIALQSGSDRILTRMRRFYKAQEFVEVTNKIRAANPNTFIGVDVIVGFPGEGEPEFEETVHCLQNSYWTKLHVFPFSLRNGTAAESLDGTVSDHAKFERAKMLRAYSDIRYNWFINSQVGREVDVLIERPSTKEEGMWLGHTENYLPTISEIPQGANEKTIHRARIVEIEGERSRTIPI